MKYIYMGLWWPPAASYNCAQVRHHSPAGTFTRVPGRCLRWSPTSQGPRWPPAYRYIKYKKFYVYSDGTHTHAHTPYDFHLSAQIYLLHAINSKDHKIIMAVSSYKLENNVQLKMWKNAIQKCEEMWKMWKMLKKWIYMFQYFSQFKF